MTPEENEREARRWLEGCPGDHVAALICPECFAKALAAREAATVERCAKVAWLTPNAEEGCGFSTGAIIAAKILGIDREAIASALRATLKPETKGEPR